MDAVLQDDGSTAPTIGIVSRRGAGQSKSQNVILMPA